MCSAEFEIVSPPNSPVLLYQSQTIQIFLARSLLNENFQRYCSHDPFIPYLFPRKFPRAPAWPDSFSPKSLSQILFLRRRTSTIPENFLVTFFVWLFCLSFFFCLFASVVTFCLHNCLGKMSQDILREQIVVSKFASGICTPKPNVSLRYLRKQIVVSKFAQRNLNTPRYSPDPRVSHRGASCRFVRLPHSIPSTGYDHPHNGALYA